MKGERKRDLLFFAAVALLYLLAPFQGIRWGDGLEFTAVASHLGVAHPSGYPLFTLLGWFFLQLPHEEPYRALLWLCRTASFAAVAGLYLFIKSIFLHSKLPPAAAMLLAGAYAVGIPFWQTLHHAEVYSLNAAFLIWIVYLVAKPQGPAKGELLLAAALQGLAIANHLSSLCTLPLLALVLTKRRDAKLIAVSAALVVFLPFLLYASLWVRVPGPDGYGIGWGNPTSISSWLFHIRGGEYGQYQFLRAAPGIPFTYETYLQFALHRLWQLLSSFGAIITGHGPTAPVIGFAIMLLAGLGFTRKSGVGSLSLAGILVALGLQLAFIFTYNIPDIKDYFLSIQILAVPFAASGMILVLRPVFATEEKRHAALKLLSLFVLLLAALATLIGGRAATADLPGLWRDRVLEALPENAGLLTIGDADTYTMWYVQFAQRERRDVAVFGGNFVRFPWFRQSLPPDDPRREAVGFIDAPPGSLEDYIANLRNLVIEPMLAHGPLYTTMNQPAELRALESHYHIEPAAALYTDAEWDTVVRSGEVNIAPPYLYEIRRR